MADSHLEVGQGQPGQGGAAHSPLRHDRPVSEGCHGVDGNRDKWNNGGGVRTLLLSKKESKDEKEEKASNGDVDCFQDRVAVEDGDQDTDVGGKK